MKSSTALLNQGDEHAFVRAKALAEGLKEAAAELRLIDVADFIAYIRCEQFANIEDLVNSSVELFFKEGTLSFGWAADMDVKWGSPPTVRLDMEFRHGPVAVFFNLTLRSWHGRIDIHHISFDSPSDDPNENTQRLIEAIADAKLPHRAPSRDSSGKARQV